MPDPNPDAVAIYAGDFNNGRIVRVNDMSAAGWTAFGGPGSGTGQFSHPWHIFVDGTGRIFIADRDNHRIVRMDNVTGAGWVPLGTFGSGVNQFNLLSSVALDALGRIHLVDHANTRIVRIDDMTGAGWTTFGVAAPPCPGKPSLLVLDIPVSHRGTLAA